MKLPKASEFGLSLDRWFKIGLALLSNYPKSENDIYHPIDTDANIHSAKMGEKMQKDNNSLTQS